MLGLKGDFDCVVGGIGSFGCCRYRYGGGGGGGCKILLLFFFCQGVVSLSEDDTVGVCVLQVSIGLVEFLVAGVVPAAGLDEVVVAFLAAFVELGGYEAD